MAKDMHVWTVCVNCLDAIGNVQFRSESVYESLYDALHRIGIWYNIKTKQGFDINIENEEIRPDETTFAARKENESVQLILQRVTYRPKKQTPEP